MKLFKFTLTVCSYMVLGSSIYAMEFSRGKSTASATAGGGRAANASSTAGEFQQEVAAKTQEFFRKAINGSRGSVGGKVNPAENAYAKEHTKIERALQGGDLESVLEKIKSMKDELKIFIKTNIKTQGEDSQLPADIEFISTALRHAKDAKMMDDPETLKSIYMLLYSYVRIPGSMMALEASRNMSAASTTRSRSDAPDPMAVKADARDFHIRQAGMRRDLKAQAQELGTTLCPDNKVIGKLTKELFPYFSAAAFEGGMITDICTGDRKPLGTVELKAGQYWKVYAMEISKQSAPNQYYGHHGWGHNPAQEFFTDAIQKIAGPYAERFNKDTAGLLAEHDDNGQMMHGGGMHHGAMHGGGGMHNPMQQTPVPESMEAKRLKKSMTADGGGAFWKRDTSYDDGYSQSGMCTYVASTFESGSMLGNQYGGAMGMHQQQTWQPNGDLINYTFVFERTDAPGATDSFMQRVYADRRVYLTRVYAERREYYMRRASEASEQGDGEGHDLMMQEAQNIDSTIAQFGQEAVQGRAEKALRSAAAAERWGRN